jgi:hypothetical protein
MKKLGLILLRGDSAIVPMLYDAKLSQTMADELLKKEFMGSFFLWYQRIKHELECNCLQHTLKSI